VISTIVDALVPVVAEARGLIDLRHDLTSIYPTADSDAMGERLDDARLADVWSAQPVTDAQNYCVQLIHVCEDHLESMCRLVADPAFVPVWGLLPLARALLEAAGRACDLGETRIGARQRVQRYMNERLYALHQIGDLPSGARHPEGVRDQRAEILESARRLGFPRTPHSDPHKAAAGSLASPAQFGSGRPRDLEVVRRVFEDARELGDGAYRWFAAAAHATAWEVQKPFAVLSSNAATGSTSVVLGRHPVEVHQFVHAGLLGYIRGATVCLELHGWLNQSWRKAAINAMRISRSVGEFITANAQAP
jgi:hypothetical protein